MEIRLINESLFKANSPVTDGTVIKEFIPYILIAQKMHTERVLGRPLSDELKLQIKEASENPEASPFPITPANQALIEVISPSLSFYAVYEGLPYHWATITNKGITARESENSKAVEMKDIAQLRRWTFDTAKAFERDLIGYLTRCKDKYPLWQPESGCGCGLDSETGSKESPIGTGIYFPK